MESRGVRSVLYVTPMENMNADLCSCTLFKLSILKDYIWAPSHFASSGIEFVKPLDTVSDAFQVLLTLYVLTTLLVTAKMG